MNKEQLLFQRLNDLAIDHETYTHRPLYTIEDSLNYASHIPDAGAQCKSLFLKDKKGRLWLIVAHDDTKISLKEVSKSIQASGLRFADETLLFDTLGVRPGSVTPFGLINDTQKSTHVVLDVNLFSFSLIGFHPLRNDSTVTLKPLDLLRFITSCTEHYQLFDFGKNETVDKNIIVQG